MSHRVSWLLPLRENSRRVAVQYEPTRYCEGCGSFRLGLIDHGGGHWRKECLDCGSTGPFCAVTK